MQYALLFYQSPDEFAARTDPKKREAFWASFIPYMKALTEAGIVVAGAGLEPPDVATSIRLSGGKRQVQDGPFAETKEQLGGFFIIEVAESRRGARMGGPLSGRAGRRRRGASRAATDGSRDADAATRARPTRKPSA